MSAADQLPVDARLPKLSVALCEATMARHFADTLRGQGLQVDACLIDRVKYRPQRNCSIAYRLRLRDADGLHAFEQRVSARLCNADETATRAARAMHAPLVASGAGPAIRLLPQLDMMTWWWPNDARLAAPRLFGDAVRMRESVLPDVVARLGGGTLRDCRWEPMQYVPEQRLTMRVDLGWQGRDGATLSRRLFAKAAREARPGHGHAILQAIAASESWRSGRLRTPAPVHWQAEHALSWQGAVAGQALALDPAGLDGTRADALGRQLADLHALSCPALPAFDPGALQARLAATLQMIARARPDARAALERLDAPLRAGLDRVAAQPDAQLHGDLHAHNVLVDGPEVALIDLDGGCRAPAVIELGGWIADAMHDAVLAGADPLRARGQWERLLAAYAGAGGHLPARDLLDWSTAWNLTTKRAWRAVANLKPGRFAAIPRMLEIAGHLVGATTVGAAR